eukprot:2639509-Rhodomonas_salina.1
MGGDAGTFRPFRGYAIPAHLLVSPTPGPLQRRQMLQLIRHAVYFNKPVTPTTSDWELCRHAKVRLPSRPSNARPAAARVGLRHLPTESVLQWVRNVGWDEEDHLLFRHTGS